MPTAGEARLKKAKSIKTVGDRRARGNLLTLHHGKRTGTNKESYVTQSASAGNKSLDRSQSRSNIALAAKRRPAEITKVRRTGKVPKGKENVETKQESVAQKGTRKPAPDFSKIHKTWELTMAKGKAVKKKGNTKFEAFVLSENGAKQKNYAYNIDEEPDALGEDGDKFDEEFKVDHTALQGILDNTGIKYEELASKGRATIATIPKNTANLEHSQLAGVLKRTSIYYDGSASAARKPFSGSVPVSKATTPKSQPHATVSSCTKKRVAWADNAETEDEFGFKPNNKALQSIINNTGDEFGFKPDNKALQSILNNTGDEFGFKPDNDALQSILTNTGIDDRHLNRKNATRTTLATCSSRLTPFRHMRQNADQFTRPSPKRTSIYYTGPRYPRSRASPARPSFNGTALGRTENQCSGTPRKNVANQTCYNPASTVVGFQAVAADSNAGNVSTAAVMQPLQPAVSTPRVVRLQGEANSVVFAVPYAVPDVGSRTTRSSTKAPQSCWADILTPRTQGLTSADVLTPRTQRPIMSRAPPPVYNLGEDLTPRPPEQPASQSVTPTGQGVRRLGIATPATEPNQQKTNQTTPLLRSLTPKGGIFGNSCAPVVGFAPILQREKNFGNILQVERDPPDQLMLGVLPSPAPGRTFESSSATVAQIHVPSSTCADVTNSSNHRPPSSTARYGIATVPIPHRPRAPLSTPHYGIATVATPQGPSQTYGCFPVSEKQHKELQALEEKARRDLELLRVKHQEIERQHFVAISCDGKQLAPLAWSSCERLDDKAAEGTGQVEGIPETSCEKQDWARLGEIQYVREGPVTTQDSVNQHVIAARPIITPEGSTSKEYRKLWSSTVQPQGCQTNATVSLASEDRSEKVIAQSIVTPTPIKTRKTYTDMDHDANSVGSPAVMGFLSRPNTSPFRIVALSRNLISSTRKSRPAQFVSATPKNLMVRENSANSSLDLRAAVGNLGSAFHSTSSIDRQVVEKNTGVERVQNRLHWDAEPSGIVESSVSSTFWKVGANMPTLVLSNFTQEAMLDAEVALCISGGRVLGRAPVRRELVNPLAKMFKDGDERHFVPVNE